MADKIDMSLDEIIKLNGVSKRGQGGRGNRGRGSYGRGRRYRGRGQASTSTRESGTSTRPKTRGRRGSRVWSRRATGRSSHSLSQQSVTPSLKSTSNNTIISQNSQPKKFSQKRSVQNRMTSRSLAFTRGRRGTRVFRGTRRDSSNSRGASSATVNRIRRGGSRGVSGAAVSRIQWGGSRRGSGVLQRGGSRGAVSGGMQRGGSRGAVSGGMQRGGSRGAGSGGFMRMQKQAIQALWKAKSTLSKINAQVMRNNIVESKRGLPPSEVNARRLTNNATWKSQQQVRSQRRNLSSNRNFSNPSLTKRNLNNSTLSLKSKGSQLSLDTSHSNSTLSLNSQGIMKQRRPWRSTSMQDDPSKMMTISVQNSSRQPLNQDVPDIKPTTSLKFNFTSGLFVPGSTGVSLNERFTSTDMKTEDSSMLLAGDRKVFF